MKRAGLLAVVFGVAAGCSEAPAPRDATDATKLLDVSDPHARAAAKAINYLISHQNADGGFGSFKGKPQSTVGVTALVAYSLMTSPAKLTESSSPALAKAVQYILSCQEPSGAISDPALGLDNYTTSAGAMALKAAGNPAYRDAIEKAKAYLSGIQLDEGEGLDKGNANFGGAPYKPGRPVSDGSNTGMWMDAMRELGVGPDDPAMQNALVFIKRLQNNPEVNDMEWAKAVGEAPEEFGSGVYRPVKSPDRDDEDISKAGRIGKTGWRGYGSMTYQMFKGFIYAGLDRDDPAVKGALKWIENNYTLDENPGIGADGQYYYYRVFARALGAWGEKEVAGHDWAKDVADKLAALQNDDGSWVNPKDRWYEGDPALVTAYCLETLSIAMEALGKSD